MTSSRKLLAQAKVWLKMHEIKARAKQTGEDNYSTRILAKQLDCDISTADNLVKMYNCRPALLVRFFAYKGSLPNAWEHEFILNCGIYAFLMLHDMKINISQLDSTFMPVHDETKYFKK